MGHFFFKESVKKKKMKVGMILTYFDGDFRVQIFQLRRHAVSLNASQLG